MKYVAIVLFAILMTVLPNNFAEAKGNSPKFKEVTPADVKYVTTEDILLGLIRPKVEQIVQKQYGQKDLVTNFGRVHSAGLVHGFAKHENDDDGWFQIKMSVLVGEPPNVNMDGMVIRVDAPYIGEHRSDNIKDIQVDLIKYWKSK